MSNQDNSEAGTGRLMARDEFTPREDGHWHSIQRDDGLWTLTYGERTWEGLTLEQIKKIQTGGGDAPRDDMQRQSQFVADLIGNVRSDILRTLAEYKIPANWDGIELRRYIAYKFNDCIMGDIGT